MSARPSLDQIRACSNLISDHVIRTPTVPYYGEDLTNLLGPKTRVSLKLELLQRTGSFKPRGAINVVLHLSEEEKSRGITALSAGNHAIATAYAARAFGLSVKVVMPITANPFRVARCQALGAEIIFADDMDGLFGAVEKLQQEEGRVMVHPFEGPHTFAGTGTVGLEFMEDAKDLEAVIVPIGGGGLISGISSAVKQINPNCKVYGVEPELARGMSDSLAAGKAIEKVAISSIADSLSAPFHTSGAFEIIRENVDEVVTISDSEMVSCMKLMFTDLKLAVEPAGASALAALLGPLRDRCAGKHVGVLVCGTNIDQTTYQKFTGSA
ncbi:MAG: pyridoxal-phosphate dependent enzyme [Pseudomonadota bacterium]